MYPLTVVLRRTVAPGTTERVLRPALRDGVGDRPDARVRVAVNPEFLREGTALADFEKPPFTLVGSDDPAAAALVRSLYVGIRAPYVRTSVRTAELAGYAYAHHGLEGCPASERADLANALDRDAEDVTRILLMDRRRAVSGA